MSAPESQRADRSLAAGLRRDPLGVLIFLASVTLVVSLSWFKIGNLDLGYHIAYGRHFLQTGEIVGFAPDPFLYPESGVPFVNANWGSQIVLAAVERVAGVGGLFALRLVLIGVIFTSVGWVCFRRTRGLTATAVAVVFGAMAAYERFSLRPELFSYAILALQLVVLDSGVGSKRRIAWLVALQLLLVNLHSYFLLGLALTLCWFVDAAIERIRRPGAETRTALKSMGIALALQMAASFVHPWHVRAAWFPFRTLGYLASHDAMGGAGNDSSSAWGMISEFQSPFSFFGEPINRFTIFAFVALVLVAFAGAVVAAGRKRWADVFAIAGFFLVATQMRRNIAPFAMVAAPLAVAEIAGWWDRRRAGATSAEVPRCIGIRSYARLAVFIGLFALIYLVWSGRMYYWERRITRQSGTGYSDVTFPKRAVTWLRAQKGLKPRLYVDYFASSNTLLWLAPEWKLFVDTNTFAYKEPTLKQAFDLGLGKIDHDEFFATHGVNVVMLHCGPDTQLLVRSLAADNLDWALVYVDSSDVIFLRRSVWDHADVILANPAAETRFDPHEWINHAKGATVERALAIGTMANVPIALGWWSEAMTLCEEAVRLAPDDGEMWLQLGICHGNLGNAAARSSNVGDAIQQWREAEKCFLKAIEFNDRDGQAAKSLRRVRRDLESASRAVRANRR